MPGLVPGIRAASEGATCPNEIDSQALRSAIASRRGWPGQPGHDRRSAIVCSRTRPAQSTSNLTPCASGRRAAVVDGAGLAAHIGLPGVGAGFAPAAGLLLAAEGAADLGAGRADIHIGDAAIGADARRGSARPRACRCVKIDDDSPCGTPLCSAIASSNSRYLQHVEDRREGLLDDRAGLARHLDERRARVERRRRR